jgi:ubiquinone/menaquinone biosynthesis C-methylase UbiE
MRAEGDQLRFETHVIDPEGAEIKALRALGSLEGARVLEIGCGDGRLTVGFAPIARSVLALDPRAEALAKARRNLPVSLAQRVRFEIGSILDLDCAPASFDVALFSHSL